MPRVLAFGHRLLTSPEQRVPLEANGYRIHFTDSLQEAVAMVLEDPPDFLVTALGLDEGADVRIIRVVKGSLQKANLPVLLVVSRDQLVQGIDWRLYPVDDLVVRPISPEVVLARIRLAEARLQRVFDNNPLSRLPGNTSILRAIQKAIDSGERWAICYVDINNFKPYNDRYGFSQGDDVILVVARLVANAVDEQARDMSFVGHVGGDDFVFLVSEDKAKSVCSRIIANFEAVKNMFIDPEDLKTGGYMGKDRQGRETHYGLLSLSIAAVTTGGRNFRHSGEVAAAASQLKQYVKSMEGSNYLIDRRKK